MSRRFQELFDAYEKQNKKYYCSRCGEEVDPDEMGVMDAPDGGYLCDCCYNDLYTI